MHAAHWKRNGFAWGKIALVAAILAAVAAAWRFTSLSEFVTPDNAIEWAHRVRRMPAAPLVIVFAYTVAALVMFPRPLITLASIVAFGTLAGVAYAGIGIMVAAFAFFYAGRFLPERQVVRLGGTHMKAVQELLRSHGVLAIFALNMVPAPPFSVQGVVAGASRLPAWQYALGSFLGMLPTLIGWTFFGHQIVASLEGDTPLSRWLLAAVVVAMIALTVFVRRWVRAHSTLGARAAAASG